MQLDKYSIGIGDRFGRQGKAQLQAALRAREAGVAVTPVWNKSYREHSIIGTSPKDAREEADAAVAALAWDGPYCVDADHIGMGNVDLFMAASDFFTLDVADFIGTPAAEADIDAFLDKHSGLLGIGGIGSGDMRDILAAEADGRGRARLALDMFVYRLVSYIGAYHVVLDGADAVGFTGGIGENSAPVRRRVVERLRPLGCHLAETNEHCRGAAGVSTPASALQAVVMPTNEELMIAMETVRVTQDASPSG